MSIVCVHWFDSLTRFIDSIHWFASLIRFIDSIHWFDSLIRFTDPIHWFDSLIRFTGSIHWFDSLIRFIDSVHWLDSLILGNRNWSPPKGKWRLKRFTSQKSLGVESIEDLCEKFSTLLHFGKANRKTRAKTLHFETEVAHPGRTTAVAAVRFVCVFWEKLFDPKWEP